MRHVNAVCEKLEAVIAGLETGEMTPQVATEINNAAGKIIKAKTSQLVYYQDRKEPPNIKFWEEK